MSDEKQEHPLGGLLFWLAVSILHLPFRLLLGPLVVA